MTYESSVCNYILADIYAVFRIRIRPDPKLFGLEDPAPDPDPPLFQTKPKNLF